MFRFRPTYSSQLNWSRWFGVTLVMAAMCGRAVRVLELRVADFEDHRRLWRDLVERGRAAPRRCCRRRRVRRPPRAPSPPTSAVVVDFPLEPVMPIDPPGAELRGRAASGEVIGMPSSRARAAPGCGAARTARRRRGRTRQGRAAAARDDAFDALRAAVAPAASRRVVGAGVGHRRRRRRWRGASGARSRPFDAHANRRARACRAHRGTSEQSPFGAVIIRAPPARARRRASPPTIADDPEARHDLGFGPAARFEVVVERRALEDALAAAQLEVADLDDVAPAISTTKTTPMTGSSSHWPVISATTARLEPERERAGVAHDHAAPGGRCTRGSRGSSPR